MIYRLFFQLVLRHIDAERAHALAARTLRTFRATTPGRAIVRWLVGPIDTSLETRVLGLTFPSPLGVAAGVDKDATWFDDLGALSFGFVEVGTVTALRQAGNPRPRVARLIGDRAILNKMGFPNPGADQVAARLARRTGDTVVGVNIGKSRLATVDAAGADYRASVRALAQFSDYVVINVSSPNTPGLREMQATDLLGPLIDDVKSELAALDVTVPVLIKIGPDLTDEQLDAVSTLALELEVDGIVAVNTTVERDGLTEGADPLLPSTGAGFPGHPSEREPSRSCATSAQPSATGSCSSRSAESRAPTMRGNGSSPEPRLSKCTQASSTGARIRQAAQSSTRAHAARRRVLLDPRARRSGVPARQSRGCVVGTWVAHCGSQRHRRSSITPGLTAAADVRPAARGAREDCPRGSDPRSDLRRGATLSRMPLLARRFCR